MVKQYGCHKDVRIMSARVVHNRFDDDIVGCKITVPEADVESVTSRAFWPAEVECRLWTVRGDRRPLDSSEKKNRRGNISSSIQDSGVYRPYRNSEYDCQTCEYSQRSRYEDDPVDYWDYDNAYGGSYAKLRP